ncbi:MAG: DUF1844 domain-containing protein [Armatimonadota bacterium]
MAESEKTGYEATENSKAILDESGDAQTQPEEPVPNINENSEYADVEKEAHEDEVPNLPPVDIYSMMTWFIQMLGSQVWQWLGLMKNPSTGQLDKDLAQARIAIDTIAFMVNQLEGKLTPQEQREMQSILSDLRVNFVQQSAKESK